jgi:hypothetical protein
MIAVFDEAIVTTWGEGERRARPAGGDGATARQLVSLGVPEDEFRTVCLDTMGRLAIAAKNPPGSLSYCLTATLRAREERGRSAAPTKFAVTAKTPFVYLPKDEAADRLASFGRTGIWHDSWGPRPAANPPARAKEAG